jgi:hypothetical protein
MMLTEETEVLAKKKKKKKKKKTTQYPCVHQTTHPKEYANKRRCPQ